MMPSPMHVDERTAGLIQRICTAMYLVTIAMLIGAMSYREFVIGQPIRQFEDIAVIVTLNVLVALGASLYLIGLSLPRTTPLIMVAIYAGFVAVGFGFTMFKDAILLDKQVDLAFALGKLRIVAVICGLMVLIYSLIAWLGQRRIERELG